MHINIAWQDVDTVLLDMDGTLLDLAPHTGSHTLLRISVNKPISISISTAM